VKKLSKLSATLGLTLMFSLAAAGMAIAADSTANLVYKMNGVPQTIGIPDKPYSQFTVAECRGCHMAAGDITTANLHHATATATLGNCLACHKDTYPAGAPDGVINEKDIVAFDRTCTSCHTTSWHHQSTRALGGECNFCHQSDIVAEQGTGLVAPHAPTYPPSDITPKPADCANCHIEFNPLYNPLDTATGQSPNRISHHSVSSTCSFCHDSDPPQLAAPIRACESCHTITSLHTFPGHLASNDRCVGCHGANVPAYTNYISLPPSVESITKTTAIGNTYFYVYGDGFGTNTKQIFAYMSKTDAAGVVVNTAAPITQVADTVAKVMVPNIAPGNYDFFMRNALGESNRRLFTIVKPANITTLSPSIGTANSVLTLNGAYFNNGAPVVKFTKLGAVSYTLTPTTILDNKLTVNVPADASGAYTVTVQNNVGTSNGVTFSIAVKPVITSIFPTSQAIGKSVNLNGTDLIHGGTTIPKVFVGTVEGKITYKSATKITFTVPTGLTRGATYQVKVFNGALDSNTVALKIN